MPVTNYYTVDGQMIGYKTAAGRKDFLTDALGSVTAEVDSTGATKTFDGRYKPYGGDLSSTGTRGSYGWIGSWGYRETGLIASAHYVRGRHYMARSATWTSKDHFFVTESPYGYVNGRAMRRDDRSGWKPEIIGDEPGKSILSNCCKDMARLKDKDVRNKIKECMKNNYPGTGVFDAIATIDWFLDVLEGYCTGTGKRPDRKVPNNNVCIYLGKEGGELPNWPGDCPNPCKEGFWAYTFPSPDPHDTLPKGQWCKLKDIFNKCEPPRGPGAKCSCTIAFCESGFNNGWQSPCAVLYHELAHCTGLGHDEVKPPPKGFGKPSTRDLDFVYKLGCCICRVVKEGSCGIECDRVK